MKSLVFLAAFVALSSAQFQGFGQRSFGAPAARSFGAPAARSFAAPAARSFAAPAAKAFAAPAARSFAAPAPAPRASFAPSGAGDQAASVVRSESDINPDGTYSYVYETSNGLAGQAQGSAGGESGSFSWTSPEGVPVGISYVADENGYQPSGDALPIPPPIPPQIARALEWLARNAPPQPQQ